MRRGMAVVLLLPVLLLAGCYARGQSAPAAGAGPTVPPARGVTATAVSSTAGIPRITVDELAGRLAAGETIIVVDVRSQASYEQQHIAGAISMPEAQVPARAGELPLDRLIVFYCA